jgi:hypothetical protein
VQFLGIFTDTTYTGGDGTGRKYIVTEYLSKGSLDLLIRTEKSKLGPSDLIEMYVVS